ncbi:MAG: hypothetical protein WCG45_03605 [bacterium]
MNDIIVYIRGDMIICEKDKWVFVRNTKTASRSLTNFLLNKFDCFEFGTYHGLTIPDTYKDFTVFIVLRNPLSRAVSAWKHIVIEYERKMKPYVSFKDYLTFKTFRPLGDCNFFLQYEVFQQIEKFNTRIIYYESLEYDVKDIFGDGTLKVIGKNFGYWRNEYTNELLELAIEAFDLDFKHFNYSKVLPDPIKLFL